MSLFGPSKYRSMGEAVVCCFHEVPTTLALEALPVSSIAISATLLTSKTNHWFRSPHFAAAGPVGDFAQDEVPQGAKAPSGLFGWAA